MFIVMYCGGSWEDFYKVNVFVTDNEDIAKNYVNRFNSILKKWKKFYHDKYYKEDNYTWSHRHYTLDGIDECYYQEIEKRN